MLPPEIKTLAEQAVSNEVPKYHTATREAIQQTIFEFSRRGTLKSSMFERANVECRVKTFTNFGENIAQAISQIQFNPPPNCEDELVTIAKNAMTWTMKQEIDNLNMTPSEHRGVHGIALLERCQRVIQDTETKIKIHVQSLRHHNQQRTNSTHNVIIGDGNNLQAGNDNKIENTVTLPEKNHFWEKGIFWGTLGIFLLTAILVYFEWPKHAIEENSSKQNPVNQHAGEPSNAAPKNNSDNQTAKDFQGNFSVVKDSPNANVTQVYNPQPPPEILETKTLTANEETNGIFKTVFQLRIGNLPYDMNNLRLDFFPQTNRPYILYATNFAQRSSGTYITEDSAGRSIQFQKFTLDVFSSKAINPDAFAFTVTNRPKPQ